MKHVHFFQWNIPYDNQFSGRTDRYINIIAEWNGDAFFNDGRPMCYINPVNLSFFDCIQVKDWYEAKCQIEEIAQDHFAEIARQTKIAEARATLLNEKELTGVPTLDCFNQQLVINHFTPLS